MIKIKFGYLTMEADGHAGYAEKGKDIVCAGVSALFNAAADCLSLMYAEGKLKTLKLVMMPGEVRIGCTIENGYWIETSKVFELLEAGCKRIAEEYPDNVTVETST